MSCVKSLHTIPAGGNDVTLRVFVPVRHSDNTAPTQPAVVMICGLGWLGCGVLGWIGDMFNDRFGYAFAAAGVPCVQLHTPRRHLAHTRCVDLGMLAAWPLTWIPVINAPFLVADVLLLAASMWDFAILLLIPVLMLFGPFSLPWLHGLLRSAQWLQDTLPAPKVRDHQAEIAEVVKWTQEHQEILGSNGRLVLCGYSSGAHCASLYGLSQKAVEFDSVILISGIYDIHTDAWTGWTSYLAPLINIFLKDILGVDSPEQREKMSPVKVVNRRLDGMDWHVLNAKTELLGIQPFQDLLFSSDALCEQLKSKGANVHRATCGHNHWLLIFSFDEFVQKFAYCKAVGQR